MIVNNSSKQLFKLFKITKEVEISRLCRLSELVIVSLIIYDKIVLRVEYCYEANGTSYAMFRIKKKVVQWMPLPYKLYMYLVEFFIHVNIISTRAV